MLLTFGNVGAARPFVAAAPIVAVLKSVFFITAQAGGLYVC